MGGAHAFSPLDDAAVILPAQAQLNTSTGSSQGTHQRQQRHDIGFVWRHSDEGAGIGFTRNGFRSSSSLCLGLKSEQDSVKAQSKPTARVQIRQAKEVEQFVGATSQDLAFASENQLRLSKAMNEAEKIREASAVKVLEINRKYNELLEKSKSAEETLNLQLAQKNTLKAEEIEKEEKLKSLREGALEGINEEIARLQAKIAGKEEEYLLQKKINDLVKSGGGTVSEGEAAALVQQADALQKKADAADKLKQQYESLADSISGSLTQGFRDVITGAKTAEQALSETFQRIANAFLDMAMQMIQEWLKMQLLGIIGGAFGGGSSTGFGGGYFDPMTGKGAAGPNFGLADGGQVTPGGLHLVGERGPELFAPSSSGSIVSTESIFAATRQAMADANNNAVASSEDAAFSENSAALGQSNAYLSAKGAETRLQQSLTNTPVKVEVETVRIGSMDVVSTEQFQAGMAMTAKRARAQVFSDLKNKPTARNSVGMR